jgi:hypothetical protein
VVSKSVKASPLCYAVLYLVALCITAAYCAVMNLTFSVEQSLACALSLSLSVVFLNK